MAQSAENGTETAVKYKDESWLREKYVDEELTLEEVAGFCGVTREAVRYWLEKHDIERRSSWPAKRKEASKPLRDKDWLRERFHDEGMSYKEIADLVGLTPGGVEYYLKKHGLVQSE